MTKTEAAIVTAYTGVMLGEFRDFHEYAEKLLGRPIFTHEFARQEIADKIRDLSKPAFIAMEVAG